MSIYRVVKTFPGDEDYALFESLPTLLYAENSQRFLYGNEPSVTHLEGCYVLLKDEQPVGRFAFYLNPDLKWEENRAACFGSYESSDDSMVSDRLLSLAKELARTNRCSWLIGPMEGSTWNNYRFSLSNERSNFFLEPYHHTYYNQQLLDTDFEIIAKYTSNRDHKIECDSTKVKLLEKKYELEGAIVRTLDMENLEADLFRFAEFCNEVFSENVLFTPIDERQFVQKYLAVKGYLDPTLTCIIEDEHESIQAVLFCLKDHMDQSGKTMMVKTIARRRTSPFKNVGHYFASKVVEMADKGGFESVIHAFMHDQNASLEISNTYSEQHEKSYALYAYECEL